MGLQVPRDVSVAAFDDIPFARYTVPRLTSVSTYPEESGQEAVRLLLRRLQHPDEPRQVVVSPWQLNVRESVGPAPGAAEGGPFPL
jgi:DNA-binding LacI/PurR family transcriptional regulator